MATAAAKPVSATPARTYACALWVGARLGCKGDAASARDLERGERSEWASLGIIVTCQIWIITSAYSSDASTLGDGTKG